MIKKQKWIKIIDLSITLASLSFSFTYRQYVITAFPEDIKYPILTSDVICKFNKCKGLKKNDIKKHVSRSDYYKVLRNKKAKVIKTNNLRRHNFRLFVTSGSKRILTKFNPKRYLLENEGNQLYKFTYPLHFRKFL